jgi:hypothetical protein
MESARYMGYARIRDEDEPGGDGSKKRPGFDDLLPANPGESIWSIYLWEDVAVNLRMPLAVLLWNGSTPQRARGWRGTVEGVGTMLSPRLLLEMQLCICIAFESSIDTFSDPRKESFPLRRFRNQQRSKHESRHSGWRLWHA